VFWSEELLMEEDYSPPREDEEYFTCPHCGIFGEQQWEELTSGEFPLENHPKLCRCWRCKRISLWFGGMMIIPATGGAPPPSPDLPESVRADYDEARAVAGRSRRAAAALLRVAVENLCIHLNGPQRNLDEHIGLLVAKGLAEETAEMFDAVRLVGNNAAHPIDRIGLDERPEIVQTLFWLVNEIARDVITRPKQRAAATAWIPPEERARIAARNRKAIEKLERLRDTGVEPTDVPDQGKDA
jgi:hypothetical protein